MGGSELVGRFDGQPTEQAGVSDLDRVAYLGWSALRGVGELVEPLEVAGVGSHECVPGAGAEYDDFDVGVVAVVPLLGETCL